MAHVVVPSVRGKHPQVRQVYQPAYLLSRVELLVLREHVKEPLLILGGDIGRALLHHKHVLREGSYVT